MKYMYIYIFVDCLCQQLDAALWRDYFSYTPYKFYLMGGKQGFSITKQALKKNPLDCSLRILYLKQ